MPGEHIEPSDRLWMERVEPIELEEFIDEPVLDEEPEPENGENGQNGDLNVGFLEDIDE